MMHISSYYLIQARMKQYFSLKVVIGVRGYMLLAYMYNIELAIVGVILIEIAVIAYLQKLPHNIEMIL